MTHPPTLAYFSPTGTSRRVTRAVAEGFGADAPNEIDVTHDAAADTQLGPNDLFIAAVPVYGGAPAPIALQRLDQLRGNGTPAVVLAVYGNRNFERAAVLLADFLRQRGFRIIATGAFVGEHSYSTAQTPIAPGRPNADDLQDARRFGRAVAQKMEAGDAAEVDCAELICPPSSEESLRNFVEFVKAYSQQMKLHPVAIIPTADAAFCNACGACAKVCPTGAIDAADPLHTDASKCIKCAACVKRCPQGARTLRTPFAEPLSKNFNQPKPNVTLL